MAEAEKKGRMQCLESMVELVDMAELVSMVELQDEQAQDMVELVEVRMEELVETDDRTKCPASWMDFGSSFFPSYKVQTGSLPTEVGTEGVAYSGNARSLLAWVRTTEAKTAALDALVELVHEVQIGCVPALVIWTDPSRQP